MLTYFFRAVFINLYFKTKHSNETFHLGFYSLSNVFSYRKHISSKSNISVLIISGKSRNIKIIAPSPYLITNPPPLPPFYGIVYFMFILWGSFYYDPPILRYFFGTPTPLLLELSTEECLKDFFYIFWGFVQHYVTLYFLKHLLINLLQWLLWQLYSSVVMITAFVIVNNII